MFKKGTISSYKLIKKTQYGISKKGQNLNVLMWNVNTFWLC